MPVSLDKDLFIPVNLRKKQLPAVLIYGDTAERDLAKILWNFVGGQDVRFLTVNTPEELMREAPRSALIFINVPDIEYAQISLTKILSQREDVVADVIAITAEQDIRKRLQIMSQEFDGIYNREILDLPEFKNIFNFKVSKGIRRLKAKLKQDEYNTFRGFLSASAEAFIVFDKDKRIFFVSDHYKEVYPKSADFFIRGMPVQRAFEAVAKEMGIPLDDGRYDAIKDFWVGQRGQHEFSLDNGRVLRMTATPLPNDAGTIVTTADITELTQQKNELAEKRRIIEDALIMEQEASNLQKQFISMVSHEFRTPLTIVDGNAQILERRGDKIEGEETKRRLHTIRSAVSRLVNMMEAVLSSNMLRTGKLDLNYEEFNLQDLANELCDEQKGLSRGHNIVCDVERVPKNVVLDKKVVTLVLTNLLSNAVKYTRDNPDIKLDGLIDQNHIVIKVSDNGIGIPEDELNHVFDKFFRASTSNGIAGSGVGLSLVKELVHLHGGFVDVKSAIGRGTVFEVRLPIIQQEASLHD